MRYENRNDVRPAGRRAFTMVELLVVIMIITLLASILMPAVGAARTGARAAQSKTLVFALESGVNMFRSDDMLDGDYPPSQWDATNANNDPCNLGGGYTAWGAQTLVWAVCGADLAGTPGFTSKAGGHGLRDLYLNTRGLYPRRGPFVDPSKLEVCKLENPYIRKCPMRKEILENNDISKLAPVILDGFGMPVLYYKPDRNTAQTEIWFRLPQADNEPFTGVAAGNFSEIKSQNPQFYRFFLNQRAWDLVNNAPGADRPHNYDSFVLLTAGPDTKYGTADDVANFQLNR